MKNDSIIKFAKVCVKYDNDYILNSISLDIKDGEFITFLGPSGCGKTTTLKIIGGFVTPSSGDLFFDNLKINDLPPHKRQVNTVFQRYALFPHLNVFDNIAFGLKIKKINQKEILNRVREIVSLFDLSGLEQRKIEQLSGGQQQRVAIARALINQPRVLLLDESLSALDLKFRKEMQIELKKIQQKLGITFVYVTHDQEEALTMSDRVVVMNKGSIQQIGTPTDIYNEPINAFVADFIGESNVISGVMKQDFLVEFAGNVFNCIDKCFDFVQSVDIVIRPEDLKIIPKESAKIVGVVQSVTFKGVHWEIIADSLGYKWIIHSTQHNLPGNIIGLDFSPEDIHVMKKMN